MIPPCAGIIVINVDETVLVSTQNGNYSFPKGKRNKNETSLETAWRELGEETGLEKKHVKLIDDFTIDELSDKGNIAIRYYVGILTETLLELKFDPTELQKSEWIKIPDAYILEKFKNRRKEILKQAHEKIMVVNK